MISLPAIVSISLWRTVTFPYDSPWNDALRYLRALQMRTRLLSVPHHICSGTHRNCCGTRRTGHLHTVYSTWRISSITTALSSVHRAYAYDKRAWEMFSLLFCSAFFWHSVHNFRQLFCLIVVFAFCAILC